MIAVGGPHWKRAAHLCVAAYKTRRLLRAREARNLRYSRERAILAYLLFTILAASRDSIFTEGSFSCASSVPMERARKVHGALYTLGYESRCNLLCNQLLVHASWYKQNTSTLHTSSIVLVQATVTTPAIQFSCSQREAVPGAWNMMQTSDRMRPG